MTFINRYTCTKKMLSDFYKTCVCKRYRITGLIIFLLGLVCIIYFIYSNEKTLIILNIVALVLGLILMLYHLLMGSVAYKQGCKVHGGTMKESIVTFTDIVKLDEGKTSLTYEYNQFTKIYETKDFFALMLGKYTGVMVRKSSFEKGSEKEFGKFIREHCIRCK